jgi:hypothetical protein
VARGSFSQRHREDAQSAKNEISKNDLRGFCVFAVRLLLDTG